MCSEGERKFGRKEEENVREGRRKNMKGGRSERRDMKDMRGVGDEGGRCNERTEEEDEDRRTVVKYMF